MTGDLEDNCLCSAQQWRVLQPPDSQYLQVSSAQCTPKWRLACCLAKVPCSDQGSSFPRVPCRKTLQLSRQLKDQAVEAQACYSLGNTYTLLQDYERAIEYHLKHLVIAQELGDR